MHAIHLLHDVLDAQLLARDKRRIGRVDALVLTHEAGRPLRVSTMLVGGAVRAERVGGPMRWVSRMVQRVLRMNTSGVSAIPFDKVRRIGDTIDVDVDAASLASMHLERWLRDHVVGRIPGAHGGRK